MAVVTEVEIPKPKIKSKTRNNEIESSCLEAGLHPVIAKVLACRFLPTEIPILQALSPKLSQLSNPNKMLGMEKAAARIAKAIIAGEYIGLETDHDCDGQTSHAVLYYNLVHRFLHPADKIRSYIGHRLTEGYGLSLPVAKRILEDSPRPTLIITADNGSADEPRIALLKAENIDVVVTDHHEIPKEGCPKSAFVCLNPTQTQCEYGDPYIAGCMVAWLLMAATRQTLINEHYLSPTTPNLLDSLDYVAVGTVSDCVSMARSINNRIVVSYGLRLIEEESKPCWRALKSVFPGKIRSEDLGFKIGPLLNSDGRLSTAFGSVSLLLSETEDEALSWIDCLKVHNEERKSIQKALVQACIHLAKKQIQQGFLSLALYLEEGHTGVQGIAASRIKDLFGRPTAIFAPKPGKEGYITGSVRGIEEFHVRDALQYVANEKPELLYAFGGHQGAGGLTLKYEDFRNFQALFEKATRSQLAFAENAAADVNVNSNGTAMENVNAEEKTAHAKELYPVIWTEGRLEAADLNLKLLDALAELEPFGREFEPPLFETTGILQELKAVGDGTHIRVKLKIGTKIIAGIWFFAKQKPTDSLEVSTGQTVNIIFTPKENNFRGERKCDLQIVYMDSSHHNKEPMPRKGGQFKDLMNIKENFEDPLSEDLFLIKP